MIDPKKVRQDEGVSQGLKNRNYPDKFLSAYLKEDAQWLESQHQLEALQHKRNELKPTGKPTPEQQVELKALSQEVKSLHEKVAAYEAKAKEAALYLPNIPSKDTPVGKNEDDNVVIRDEGKVPSFSFEPKPHDELGLDCGLFNFESAAKITGARFVVYEGLGAKLERALISFMLDKHTQSHGYTEMMPPSIVHEHSMLGTGQLPKFSDDAFKIEDSPFYLSPTAEVQLTNLKRESIIDEADLPLKYAAHTACFRKEAGSYGKDMKGLIRHHQFNKVELVQFTTPEQSFQALESLTENAEAILKDLELPYRVIQLCSGDLGFSAAKTYDLEVWFPAQNAYREISSCSNFLDFQSRRAMIRYRSEETGKVSYLHTINGSGLAVGRTFAAILENYQQKDGSLIIPKVLQGYMGLEKIECQTTIK